MLPSNRVRGRRPRLVIRSSRDVDVPSRATEISMGVISDTSSRIVRSPVTQTLDPPSMSLPLLSATRRIFTEVISSPRTPHTREEHTMRVMLSKIDGIWYGSKARVESTSWSAQRSSWVTHIVGVEGGRMRSSMMEQGGNMSVGGCSGGGRIRAWSLIVGLVGMVTSGRVSPNVIAGEDAQGTSSAGVIIGDTKVEIDGVSERCRARGVSGTWRQGAEPAVRSKPGHSSSV